MFHSAFPFVASSACISKRSLALCACSLLGLAVSSAVRAQDIITTDTTIDAGNSYAGSVIVQQGVTPPAPTVNLVTGGSIASSLDVYNTSIFNMSGGMVGGEFISHDSSTINISGGTLSYYVFAYDTSSMNITGGTFARRLYTLNNSTATITGGTLGEDIVAQDDSVIDIKGGNITAALQLFNNGIINIYGDGLSFDPINHEVIGTLQDGTAIDLMNDSFDNGKINLINLTPAAVPEPGSVALLVGIGTVGAGFARKRRTRNVSGH